MQKAKYSKEKHWRARKIKEAIIINAINPTKNVQSGGIMNLEKGYEMDPIWSGFNGVFREMMDGKILKDQRLSFSFIFCYCLYVFHMLW